MAFRINIIGAGLAGSEAALQLASRGVEVHVYEMRPLINTPIHTGDECAELVCSNSFKSTKPTSAAGMLKSELRMLQSFLLQHAYDAQVPAGGALALDRHAFSHAVTTQIIEHPLISLHRKIVTSPDDLPPADATIIASGPLTHDKLAHWLQAKTGGANLAFYDAAAPIVDAASLNDQIIFRASRYNKHTHMTVTDANASSEVQVGDYLNAPFSKEAYEHFISHLVAAERVVAKDFETKELFQACQPIEEIARKHMDAPRFGPMKPVGLIDPRTNRRPWAAVQLRAENNEKTAYNLVGFQTNLTFPEQKRVFRLIPGLEHAEFFRYGVMHRNTFINAPAILHEDMRLKHTTLHGAPVFLAGQVMGTEGYVEAIASGLVAALSVYAYITKTPIEPMPKTTAFGALLAYATNPDTTNYQPMHVNFGILPALSQPIKKKDERYKAYAQRGAQDMTTFVESLRSVGMLT
ncbi:MAG: methylenetetrahydrofolate--tRNA-(uracil(54)-C(5))-methyltransferase (FADH(2)-oxidizing) TrmFO [Eggerthellaceae bacterium]|nr:methylenetetrahydrofolate--tRNA-(uracil(54)-C(5))-methyltransferase (FADH(2)-oxidizing) TrmFO [Eggerthellaceae bacterium]